MKSVAQFEIFYSQFLDHHGHVVAPLPAFAQQPTSLVKFYQQMVLIRVFDQKAISLQRTGKLGTYPSVLGHEALQVGIGQAMQKQDVFLPYYRDHGTLIQRGVSMAEIYMYWGGDERGSNYRVGNKDFPPCIPIATQLLHATGVATAFKLRQQPHAALVTCGEGGTSEGDFYEAINVAGVWQLPVVFVICNNQWAISVPREKQTATATFAQKAIAAQIPGEQVDGNDVIAVFHAVSAALARARSGQGATLIEAINYRLSDHTTADDAKRYRDDAAVQAAWEKDPVQRLQNYLKSLQVWDDAQEQALQEQCKIQVEQSVQEYLAVVREPVSAMFDFLYAQLPDDILAQRELAMACGEVKHG